MADTERLPDERCPTCESDDPDWHNRPAADDPADITFCCDPFHDREPAPPTPPRKPSQPLSNIGKPMSADEMEAEYLAFRSGETSPRPVCSGCGDYAEGCRCEEARYAEYGRTSPSPAPAQCGAVCAAWEKDCGDKEYVHPCLLAAGHYPHMQHKFPCEAAPSPRAEGQPQLIELLRLIRDKAWQNERVAPAFRGIESNAVRALKLLGIDDGQANPRPYGWWLGAPPEKKK